MNKIIIYSEVLYPPFDEGIRKTAFQILKSFSKRDFRVIGISNKEIVTKDPIIKGIPTNRLLFSSKLKKEIQRFSPEIIIYIPSASGTIWSFIRSWTLKHYLKSKKVIMILLQPRKYSRIRKFIIRLFKPYKVLSPSQRIITDMNSLNINNDFISLGVDLNQFKPLESIQKKSKLKNKYNLPVKKFIILHVGHINDNRNLKELVSVQNKENQVVIVGSTSTPTKEGIDQALKNKLKNNNIIIMDQYLPHIEEIYQLSDMYIFPVRSESGVITIPLSILEAMACNLPVLTTKIGSLPKILKENEKIGLLYYSKNRQLIKKVGKIKELEKINTRKMILEYSWDQTVDQIINQM